MWIFVQINVDFCRSNHQIQSRRLALGHAAAIYTKIHTQKKSSPRGGQRATCHNPIHKFFCAYRRKPLPPDSLNHAAEQTKIHTIINKNQPKLPRKFSQTHDTPIPKNIQKYTLQNIAKTHLKNLHPEKFYIQTTIKILHLQTKSYTPSTHFLMNVTKKTQRCQKKKMV